MFKEKTVFRNVTSTPETSKGYKSLGTEAY